MSDTAAMRHLLLLSATILVACASNTPADTPADAPVDAPIESVQIDDGWVPPATGRPAPGPFPKPPDTERPEGERPPAAQALAPDASAVGRLIDGGLVAHLDFDTEAGELSLFELTAWGYTRGWTSRAALVIRDAHGAEVARSESGGGTVYQDVLPFVATESGSHTLDIVAVESGFRYRVTRHAGFAPRATGDSFRVGAREVVHDWLGDTDDSVTFIVQGPPGERIVLRAEPTTGRGVKQKRQLRRRLLQAEAGFIDVDRLRGSLGARARDDGSFPDLELSLKGAPRLAGRGHSAVVEIPEGESIEVTVRRTNEGPPGLFDLMIERSVECTHVNIRIGDDEDDPVANAEVALFREPALDLVGFATTDAEGLARVEVPVGDYTLVFRGPGGAPSTLRTRIAGEAVNLVLVGF